MKIEAKNSNITFSGSGDNYTVDFGTIKKHTLAKTEIEIKGENLTIQTFNTSCSCTKATTKKINKDQTDVEIQYKDTHIISPFNKKLYLNINEVTSDRRVTIEIKGNVTN